MSAFHTPLVPGSDPEAESTRTGRVSSVTPDSPGHTAQWEVSTLNHWQQRLAASGQSHVLQFWPQLSTPQRAALIEQLERIDLTQIQQLTQAATADETGPLPGQLAEPQVRLQSSLDTATRIGFRVQGEQLLRDGQIGVVIVAGGEGSRLGFHGAKGRFPIGPVSGASLYELLLTRITAVSQQHDAEIPVYLMTSPATHADSLAYLDEHDWFGVAAHNRHVFCQGTMPAVDATSGRLLMSAPHEICFSPDGHGGVLPALKQAGLLEQMQTSGVRHLFYCQVDNPVVPLLEPVLIGQHAAADSQVTILTVERMTPDERTGTCVLIDGQLHILEYSLIPPQIAEQRLPEGRLRFHAGNTGIHLLDVAFLRTQADQPGRLPWHRAIKSVPHLDANGRRIQPARPNAWKFERFVFDAFPHANRTLLLGLPRRESFVPLKDAESADTSPAAVQRCLSELHRDWLRSAGIEVASNVTVEISPLFATSREDTAIKLKDCGNRLPVPVRNETLYVRPIP